MVHATSAGRVGVCAKKIWAADLYQCFRLHRTLTAEMEHECQFKRHVLCFFMCYDVRPQMARFMWMLAAVMASMGLFFAARSIATAYDMQHDFTASHWIALVLLVPAHIVFMGLKYEDSSARNPDSNIDPVMVRVAIASVIVCLALGVGVSTVLDHWWIERISEEEYVYGNGPKHASPSAEPVGSGSIPLPFKSASRTPSQTPSSSPNPEIRMREFQRLSDHRATIGGVYLASLISGVVAVGLNYNLRMLPVALY